MSNHMKYSKTAISANLHTVPQYVFAIFTGIGRQPFTATLSSQQLSLINSDTLLGYADSPTRTGPRGFHVSSHHRIRHLHRNPGFHRSVRVDLLYSK